MVKIKGWSKTLELPYRIGRNVTINYMRANTNG